MPLFKYKAKNTAGETREGVVEASTEEAAITVVQKNNLILIGIAPQKASRDSSKPFFYFASVKTDDLVIFTRQLATLFGAKVPVVQSLRTLSEETSNTDFQQIIVGIIDQISGGSNLSDALAEHPDVFSAFYVNLVRSGEQSGKLHDVFEFLAGYLERSEYLASKAKNALIYPGFIFFAFLSVIIVMFTVVVPKLTVILEETGQSLPFYTEVIIFLSKFLINFGAYLLVLLIAGGIFLWRFMRTDAGREIFDRVQLNMPIIGNLYRKIYLSRLTDNLSTLFLGGIPILNALKITSDVVDNRVYKQVLLDAAQSVRDGNTISASFSKFPDIPPLVTQMVRIGEETGRLDFILNKIAVFYRQEVDNLLSNLVTLIEPVLIVSLGLGVGIVVAAIFVPLYEITNSI